MYIHVVRVGPYLPLLVRVIRRTRPSWHHRRRATRRRPLSSSARCRSAETERVNQKRRTKTTRTGPRRSCVRSAVRRAIPSRSARPVSAFGIAIARVRRNTVTNINMNASVSRRFFINVEASSISAPSWTLGLLENFPRRRSAQSACVRCRFIQCCTVTSRAAVKLFAAAAVISIEKLAQHLSQLVLSVEQECRNPNKIFWCLCAKELRVKTHVL